MSSIVAVAGGSRGLGRAIVEAILADNKHHVFILSRQVSVDSFDLREYGQWLTNPPDERRGRERDRCKISAS
jgi:NAD(P)-dependent dehydrogenase (short-subunit alcohol dehydrogenase family)